MRSTRRPAEGSRTVPTPGPHGPGAALARAWDRVADAPPWFVGVLLAVLLVLVTVVVVASGGTSAGTPHLFYLPIVLAVPAFGLRGALGTAVAASVLCGLLPVDTATGTDQALTTVLVRGAMFVVVAAVTSAALSHRRRAERDAQLRELHELLGGHPGQVVVDPVLSDLVGEVLAREAFHPVFQPIYCLEDGRLVAVEALTRFDSPVRRPPDHWFAAAHRAGLGPDLEIATIAAAVRASVQLPDGVRLSVNASPVTLADPRLLDLLRTLDRPCAVELTEHAVVHDYRLLEEPLEALRLAGVAIAVDDAGAGFSSLQHVVQVLPDVVKLDLSLTQDVARSPVRRALGGALIEFVHGMGATLVVEGVESVADLEVWTVLGADAVQGYVAGRPGVLPLPVVSPVIRAHDDWRAVRLAGHHHLEGSRQPSTIGT